MYGCGWSYEKAEENVCGIGNWSAGSKSASSVAQPRTKPTEKLLLRWILQPQGRSAGQRYRSTNNENCKHTLGSKRFRFPKTHSNLFCSSSSKEQSNEHPTNDQDPDLDEFTYTTPLRLLFLVRLAIVLFLVKRQKPKIKRTTRPLPANT